MILSWYAAHASPTSTKIRDTVFLATPVKRTVERRLWSIRVLVAPTLSEGQRYLLKKLCELELLTGSEDMTKQREALYEQIVWQHIEAEKPSTPLPATEVKEKVKQIATALCNPAKDTRETFTQRVRKMIADHFGT
jgi:hypothetical protein